MIGDPPKPDSLYSQKAKKMYGEKWKKFLEDYDTLFTQMAPILKEELIYNNEFMARFKKFYRDKKTWGVADKIADEINLKGIGIIIWNKLNPLLEQASAAMASLGINPEDFYG